MKLLVALAVGLGLVSATAPSHASVEIKATAECLLMAAIDAVEALIPRNEPPPFDKGYAQRLGTLMRTIIDGLPTFIHLYPRTREQFRRAFGLLTSLPEAPADPVHFKCPSGIDTHPLLLWLQVKHLQNVANHLDEVLVALADLPIGETEARAIGAFFQAQLQRDLAVCRLILYIRQVFVDPAIFINCPADKAIEDFARTIAATAHSIQHLFAQFETTLRALERATRQLFYAKCHDHLTSRWQYGLSKRPYGLHEALVRCCGKNVAEQTRLLGQYVGCMGTLLYSSRRFSAQLLALEIDPCLAAHPLLVDYPPDVSAVYYPPSAFDLQCLLALPPLTDCTSHEYYKSFDGVANKLYRQHCWLAALTSSLYELQERVESTAAVATALLAELTESHGHVSQLARLFRETVEIISTKDDYTALWLSLRLGFILNNAKYDLDRCNKAFDKLSTLLHLPYLAPIETFSFSAILSPCSQSRSK